jgi:hypothetical protein
MVALSVRFNSLVVGSKKKFMLNICILEQYLIEDFILPQRIREAELRRFLTEY